MFRILFPSYYKKSTRAYLLANKFGFSQLRCSFSSSLKTLILFSVFSWTWIEVKLDELNDDFILVLFCVFESFRLLVLINLDVSNSFYLKFYCNYVCYCKKIFQFQIQYTINFNKYYTKSWTGRRCIRIILCYHSKLI